MKIDCPNCNNVTEYCDYISQCPVCDYNFAFPSNKLPKDSNVTEMYICEVEHIVFRANKLYRFLIDPNCEKCKRMNVY